MTPAPKHPEQPTRERHRRHGRSYAELGELPNETALGLFLAERVVDQRHIAAEVERLITEA
ncbi:hypothetical protein [Bradyrhizobium sp. S3.9.1]|uniref:hypothetical protein n=1 Tax=Bradyrhizobium sp. S3.9.1 TaxID=3156431 RepID=UPI00339402F7